MKGFRPGAQHPGSSKALAAEWAYDELRQQILGGELAQGSIVNEGTMADLLGVSRTPLREAYRALLHEGLLDPSGPRRQVVVRVLDVAQEREIATARRALEAVVVDAAQAGLDASVVAELELIDDRMTRALKRREFEAFLDLDEQFHAVLATSARMPIIVGLLGRLGGLTRLAAVSRPLPDQELRGLHATALEALKSKPPAPEAAADLLATCADRLLGI